MTPAELKARREALGLTQLQLARALGVAYQTVFRWEQGTDKGRKPPVLLRLALERLEQEKERG